TPWVLIPITDVRLERLDEISFLSRSSRYPHYQLCFPFARITAQIFGPPPGVGHNHCPEGYACA
ncbi:MAG: hypothetical protein WBH24_02475, partial [Candidatus Acidiferrum sp.]